jgi:Inner membrane component of T3SS, cytoplasmic domain
MIWVEILSRQQEVAARFRIVGTEARIGRAYTNDVIVDDPYVAPEHLRLFRDEAGGLVVEDMGTANGVHLDGSKQRLARVMVDGRQPIRIGQTYLRIREGSFAVEPERIGRAERHALPLALAAILSVALVAIDEVRTWLNQTSEVQPTTYLAPVLGVVIAVLAWAGMWALLSRIFSGRSFFLRHLLITLAGGFVISLYNEIAQFSAYALSWTAPLTYSFGPIWLIIAVMCFLHLTKIGPPRPWLKGSIVAALLVLAVAAQVLQLTEAFVRSGRQNTVRLLMPPALRIAPLRDEAAFFAEIGKLRSTIDADRAKAGPDDALR